MACHLEGIQTPYVDVHAKEFLFISVLVPGPEHPK